MAAEHHFLCLCAFKHIVANECILKFTNETIEINYTFYNPSY